MRQHNYFVNDRGEEIPPCAPRKNTESALYNRVCLQVGPSLSSRDRANEDIFRFHFWQ